MKTEEALYWKEYIDKQIANKFAELTSIKKDNGVTRSFADRYMRTITGQQKLPQHIFRTFLKEVDFTSVDSISRQIADLQTKLLDTPLQYQFSEVNYVLSEAGLPDIDELLISIINSVPEEQRASTDFSAILSGLLYITTDTGKAYYIDATTTPASWKQLATDDHTIFYSATTASKLYAYLKNYTKEGSYKVIFARSKYIYVYTLTNMIASGGATKDTTAYKVRQKLVLEMSGTTSNYKDTGKTMIRLITIGKPNATTGARRLTVGSWTTLTPMYQELTEQEVVEVADYNALLALTTFNTSAIYVTLDDEKLYIYKEYTQEEEEEYGEVGHFVEVSGQMLDGTIYVSNLDELLSLELTAGTYDVCCKEVHTAGVGSSVARRIYLTHYRLIIDQATVNARTYDSRYITSKDGWAEVVTNETTNQDEWQWHKFLYEGSESDTIEIKYGVKAGQNKNITTPVLTPDVENSLNNITYCTTYRLKVSVYNYRNNNGWENTTLNHEEGALMQVYTDNDGKIYQYIYNFNGGLNNKTFLRILPQNGSWSDWEESDSLLAQVDSKLNAAIETVKENRYVVKVIYDTNDDVISSFYDTSEIDEVGINTNSSLQKVSLIEVVDDGTPTLQEAYHEGFIMSGYSDAITGTGISYTGYQFLVCLWGKRGNLRFRCFRRTLNTLAPISWTAFEEISLTI